MFSGSALAYTSISCHRIESQSSQSYPSSSPPAHHYPSYLPSQLIPHPIDLHTGIHPHKPPSHPHNLHTAPPALEPPYPLPSPKVSNPSISQSISKKLPRSTHTNISTTTSPLIRTGDLDRGTSTARISSGVSSMAWFLLYMGGGRGGGTVCLGCFVRGKGGKGEGERDRGGERGRWMISTMPSSLLANPSNKNEKNPYLRSYPSNNEMAATSHRRAS